jgi:hypothetical protein
MNAMRIRLTKLFTDPSCWLSHNIRQDPVVELTILDYSNINRFDLQSTHMSTSIIFSKKYFLYMMILWSNWFLQIISSRNWFVRCWNWFITITIEYCSFRWCNNRDENGMRHLSKCCTWMCDTVKYWTIFH